MDDKYFFEYYQSKDKGEQCWRWRFILNGEIFAKSEEPFLRSSVYQAIQRLKKKAKVYTTKTFSSSNKKFYWKLESLNGRTVAMSPSGHDNISIANSNMWKFMSLACKAEIRKGESE